MENKKPLLASGKIIKDYRILFEYCKIYKKEKGAKAEEVLLDRKDFDYLKKLVQEGIIKAGELLNRLSVYYEEKIDPEIAVKAYAVTYGIEYSKVDKDLAVHELSRTLAGWLIEASEKLGILEIKGYSYRR